MQVHFPNDPNGYTCTLELVEEDFQYQLGSYLHRIGPFAMQNVVLNGMMASSEFSENHQIVFH